MATVQLQQWIGDYAIDCCPAFEIDVTDAVLAMGKDAALKLSYADYEADALWLEHPDHDAHAHHGPFTVYAEDAIAAYYAAHGAP